MEKPMNCTCQGHSPERDYEDFSPDLSWRATIIFASLGIIIFILAIALFIHTGRAI